MEPSEELLAILEFEEEDPEATRVLNEEVRRALAREKHFYNEPIIQKQPR